MYVRTESTQYIHICIFGADRAYTRMGEHDACTVDLEVDPISGGGGGGGVCVYVWVGGAA